MIISVMTLHIMKVQSACVWVLIPKILTLSKLILRVLIIGNLRKVKINYNIITSAAKKNRFRSTLSVGQFEESLTQFTELIRKMRMQVSSSHICLCFVLVHNKSTRKCLSAVSTMLYAHWPEWCRSKAVKINTH